MRASLLPFAVCLATGFGLAGAVPFVGPAAAQEAPAAAATPAAPDDLAAALAKSNAYIGLMNRTLRAVESWNRYTSWVDVKKGPTGKERYIDYGLYGLYDVKDEIAKARAAARTPPLEATLDATVVRYADAYEALAPLLTAANGYYERKDWKADKMAEGKALHAKLVPAAQAFLVLRDALEDQMRSYKRALDVRSLAALEAKEGRSHRWHIRNVMARAEAVIEELPSAKSPVVDLKRFDAALDVYAGSVKEMDHFAEAYPGKFSTFESQPRSLLGKLRSLRDKLGKVKGDARKLGQFGGMDLTFLVSEYNMMVSSSDMAQRFSR